MLILILYCTFNLFEWATVNIVSESSMGPNMMRKHPTRPSQRADPISYLSRGNVERNSLIFPYGLLFQHLPSDCSICDIALVLMGLLWHVKMAAATVFINNNC